MVGYLHEEPMLFGSHMFVLASRGGSYLMESLTNSLVEEATKIIDEVPNQSFIFFIDSLPFHR